MTQLSSSNFKGDPYRIDGEPNFIILDRWSDEKFTHIPAQMIQDLCNINPYPPACEYIPAGGLEVGSKSLSSTAVWFCDSFEKWLDQQSESVVAQDKYRGYCKDVQQMVRSTEKPWENLGCDAIFYSLGGWILFWAVGVPTARKLFMRKISFDYMRPGTPDGLTHYPDHASDRKKPGRFLRGIRSTGGCAAREMLTNKSTAPNLTPYIILAGASYIFLQGLRYGTKRLPLVGAIAAVPMNDLAEQISPFKSPTIEYRKEPEERGLLGQAWDHTFGIPKAY